MLHHLRISLRRLLAAPGFTAVVVLTLALGIGATTAIFSVVDGVVLRPLPYPEPERLVAVYEVGAKDGGRMGVSPANFLDWRREGRVFERLAAFQRAEFTLGGDGAPEEVSGARVSADFFRTLGIAPARGRTLLEGDDADGAPRVAVVGHELWRTRLGADPKAVGRTLLLGGDVYTVVGVMPAGFAFPRRDAQVWTPLAWGVEQAAVRDNRSVGVVGRLAPAATPERAQTAMAAVAARLAVQHPDANKGFGAQVRPLRDDTVGDVRQPLVLLLGFVGFVLLIACANVANLQLARGAGRRKEVALRAALGAKRRQVVGGFLGESALLAAAGGALGLLVASWGVAALVRLAPPSLPRLGDVRIDGTVLAFALGITALAGLLSGVAPALHASRADFGATLKDGGAHGATDRNRALSDALVVAEVALSLLLLVGAGLMGRSLLELARVDPGFSSAGVLQARLALGGLGADSTRVRRFGDDLLARLHAAPGVRAAALTSSFPLGGGGGSMYGVYRDDRPVVNEADAEAAIYVAASPGYFAALRIPLRRGRLFDDRDRAGAPRVAVISEAMAKTFFPGEDPIGRRVRIGASTADEPEREIVGVVGDVRQFRLADPPRSLIYEPLAQAPSPFLTVVLRAEGGGDPASLAGPLRKAVAAASREVAVSRLATAEALLSDVVARPRFNATLLAVFAFVAVTLAAVGLYGVVSYSVAQRTREFGVRMALGATGRTIVRRVVAAGMARAAAGVALGIAGALLMSRLMSKLLFGVSATDPLTYVVLPAVLSLVALVASYVPARRAARVDPVVALRSE